MSGKKKLKLRGCVERAVKLLPDEDEPITSTGADEYALLVRRICAKKQSNVSDRSVEERHIADLVDQALSRVRDEGDVFNSFQREFGQLSGASSRSQFEIRFPLKMRAGQGEKPPETFEANDTTIRKEGSNRWKNAMETVRNAMSESSAKKTVPEIFRENSSKSISSRHNTFYICEIKARNAVVAHSKLLHDLDIILGKLNFAAVDWDLKKWSMDELRSSKRKFPDMISHPKIYVLFEEGKYDSFQAAQIEASVTGFRLTRGFNADFKNIRRFPPQGTGHSCDPEISRGFRALQAGLAARTNENAFLCYWRGIEEITLHDPGDSSKSALERSLPLVHNKFDRSILKPVFSHIAEKRNDIVHSGRDSPVYVQDVLLLRQLLYHSIKEIHDLRESSYSRNQIVGVLNYGLSEEGTLEQKQKSHERNRSKWKKSLEEIEGARRWQNERASPEFIRQARQLRVAGD